MRLLTMETKEISNNNADEVNDQDALSLSLQEAKRLLEEKIVELQVVHEAKLAKKDHEILKLKQKLEKLEKKEN